MAITQALCTTFKVNVLKGLENFNTGSPYVYKIALYNDTANLNVNTSAYTTTGEVTGANYVAGGKILTPSVPVGTSQVAIVSFTNVTWSSVSITSRGALIYNSTTGAAVAVLDFGANKTSSGTFTILFPPANSNSAIIRIS
jgi:hypothetical protein